MCLAPAHLGKCDKALSGRWCGICLASIPEGDLLGPVLPEWLLLKSGCRKTDHFCHRCGTTVCELHGKTVKIGVNRGFQCADGDCRLRAPKKNHVLRLALDKYVEDWRTGGPARCSVCGLPAPGGARGLCYRHYQIWLRHRDDPEFAFNAKEAAPKGSTLLFKTKLPRPLLDAVEAEAASAGLDAGEWVRRLLEQEIERRLETAVNGNETLLQFKPPA